MNNYEWSRLAYIAFVKHLKHSWDDNLENWRLEIFKLESASRRILVDAYNKAIAEEYPEEKREQYKGLYHFEIIDQSSYSKLQITQSQFQYDLTN